MPSTRIGKDRLPDDIHPGWRSSGRGALAACCRLLLHAFGWRTVLRIPPIDHAVVVFYPHTSNWDFVIGLLAKFALGVPASWAGKDNMFRWPFAGLWKRLGGIPVNRRASTGFVEQMAREFERRPRMLLAIAPEGTRRHTTHWKSGAWRVALVAGVPIALAFIDFERREIGIGALMQPTGDADADIAAFNAFYAGKAGRHPSKAGVIAFDMQTIISSTERAGPGVPAVRAVPAAHPAPPSGP